MGKTTKLQNHKKTRKMSYHRCWGKFLPLFVVIFFCYRNLLSVNKSVFFLSNAAAGCILLSSFW